MTLPKQDTIISYPTGTLEETARVLHIETLLDGRQAVILDRTPCHPVDAFWPDQGADRATIHYDGGQAAVLDCQLAATDGSALYVGADLPVRQGTEGWSFLAAHLLPADVELTEGSELGIAVDASYRRALSRGHSACHLVSLALNQALSGHWTKEVRTDALGAPDFDGLAISSSSIVENGSIDVFRLNKSLRRKGFNAEGLPEQLSELTSLINQTVAEWVQAAAPIRIDREGDRLTDRRYWSCALPEGEARIACGGTHLDSTSALVR